MCRLPRGTFGQDLHFNSREDSGRVGKGETAQGTRSVPELGLGPWAGATEVKFGGLPEREFRSRALTALGASGAPLLGAVWSRL